MTEKVQKNEIQSSSGQLYLDKDFSVELNFKLWTTKGARFKAVNILWEYIL